MHEDLILKTPEGIFEMLKIKVPDHKKEFIDPERNEHRKYQGVVMGLQRKSFIPLQRIWETDAGYYNRNVKISQCAN